MPKFCRLREAAERGRQAHREFDEKVRAKANQGWQSQPTIKLPDGRIVRPDAVSPGGRLRPVSLRPVELKPNTPSGRARGARQLDVYEKALGKKGRVVYYNPGQKLLNGVNKR